MSELFIGLTMLVTLSSPPGAQLRGRVSSVIAGKSLTLRDVYLPQNGNWITEITIQASNISDLKEASEENLRPLSTQPDPIQSPENLPPVYKPATFEDPAILSMGKRPNTQSKASVAIELPTVVTGSLRQSIVTNQQREREVTPAAVLIEPLSGLGVGEGMETGLDVDPTITVKKTRRRRTRKGGKQGADLPDGDENLEKTTPVAETKRGKGWRQTPLLEPNPSFQPFSTLKRRGRKPDYENGWATEDATDVQDMGDFDFEKNLSKFDKKTVFDGIKAKDVISDGDRLVGHNRLPKPGTAGGKNLAPTENVLDLLKEESTWNSEADSDAEVDAVDVNPRDTGSGRNSRRAESRLRRPLSVSRKASSVNPPTSRGPVAVQAAAGSSRSSFYLVPANRRCEVVSSLQMLNLENIANGELGLTEDMMTENAARGIAEVALSALTGGSRLTQGTSNTLPYVVVFAGNNKSGQRAVAAGRHLRNHGANVVVCVLGIDREPELFDGLRRQLKVFRSFGGKVISKSELFDYVKTLDVPVELIIDGLLGLTISFEELRTGDQATAYELIEWANRSKAAVLAVDIPTGLDPTSGKVSIIDGAPLYIHAKYVVSMGAPKKGLLEAMTIGDGLAESKNWQLFVADIGIANQVWKKAGTRVRRGIEFEGTWVVGIRFQRGVD